MEHELKTWPEFFQAIVEGHKPFEYRLNDRNYQVGDVLHLREYVPTIGEDGEAPGHYTGRSLRKSVTYVLDDRLGPTMREGFVIMTLGALHVGPDIEPSPWVPMSKPRDISVIGKNLEELGEGVAALARALIQGMDGTEPSTGKSNRQWVQEELSDVRTTADLTVEHFDLDEMAMGVRSIRKASFLRRWFGIFAP